MIICGDALTELRKLPDESIHCCITSPPYWGLRDYGVDGQLGLEKTPEEYVNKLVEIFREVKRALRKDGTLWLNLGDSYSGSGKGIGSDHGKAAYEDKDIHKTDWSGTGLKPKDLVGIPWRVAFALQADGWYLRQDIIWAKPNPMPESVTDRCTKAHEYIFMLSKSAKYYYDAEAIKEDQIEYERNRRLKEQSKGLDTVYKISRDGKTGQTPAGRNGAVRNVKRRQELALAGKRNRRSVWMITTKPMPKIFGAEHFATFPPEIPELCIKAGCPAGGIVLDPFFGAGTTGQEALRLGRKFTGIELNPKYCEMAERRIYADIPNKNKEGE